jgi:phage baseplate assembly protein W
MVIQTTRPTPKFKDFYNNFEAHPVRKDLFVLTDVDDIKNSIKNLIFTNPGERFFNPYLGGGIKQFLFEDVSTITSYNIQTHIEATIENFEPRAKLIGVYVTPVGANGFDDSNSYTVTIIFSTINNPSPITFDVLLTRVR